MFFYFFYYFLLFFIFFYFFVKNVLDISVYEPEGIGINHGEYLNFYQKVCKIFKMYRYLNFVFNIKHLVNFRQQKYIYRITSANAWVEK